MTTLRRPLYDLVDDKLADVRRDLHVQEGVPLSVVDRKLDELRWRLYESIYAKLRARGLKHFEILGTTAADPLATSEAEQLLERALSVNDSEGLYVRAMMSRCGYFEHEPPRTDAEIEEMGWDTETLPDLLGLPGLDLLDACGVVATALAVRDRIIPRALAIGMFAAAGWARRVPKVRVYVVPKDLAQAFILEHHRTGPEWNPRGLLFAVGAVFDGRLVAVATATTPSGNWSAGRCPSRGILELSRVAAVGGVSVRRRGRVVPISAGSKLTAHMLGLLERAGRGVPGCLFVTYSLTSEPGTTYLSLADKGLRPVKLVRGTKPHGARAGTETPLKRADKILWEAGPAARPPDWSLLLHAGETLDPPPARLRGPIIAFSRTEVRRLAPLVRAALTPDVRQAATEAKIDDGCTGYCYVASEALWHLLGGPGSPYRPHHVEHEGRSHWYLATDDGEVVDLTACQFTRPAPYADGTRRAFLNPRSAARGTVKPSARTRTVIERVLDMAGTAPSARDNDAVTVHDLQSRDPEVRRRPRACPRKPPGRPGRDPELIVRAIADGVRVLNHPAIVEQHARSLEVESRHSDAVLVPCARTKPFPRAPSHARGYLPALRGLPVDVWVVSEPVGVIPYEWSPRYPNAHYDFPPERLVGEARDILVDRIAAWLTAVGSKYRSIHLALPRHHMSLVNDAIRRANVYGLTTFDQGIGRCRQVACEAGDFRPTTEHYRAFLRREVQKALTRLDRAAA